MNRRLWMSLVLGGGFALSAALARAQEAPPPPLERTHEGGLGGDWMAPPMGDRIELLGFAGLRGGKVVTGAPFCATATTTQTLADGKTHITRTSSLCRDSQGRVSREVTLPGGSHSFVVISDPKAGKQYLLRPDQKVAYEMPAHRMKGGAKGLGQGGPGNRQWKGNADASVQKETLKDPPPINIGMKAEGTRYTWTILAGQIGNDMDIHVVSERWYCSDLQVVCVSTHSDPRFGSTMYVLSNIKQQEPPAEMFTVPVGYTTKQGGGPRGMRRFRGGPPPAPPADAPAPPPGD